MYEDTPIPLGPKPKTKSRVSKKLRKKLIQYILFFWEKQVICTPERESARENNRKATNSDRGTRAFVFVG